MKKVLFSLGKELSKESQKAVLGGTDWHALACNANAGVEYQNCLTDEFSRQLGLDCYGWSQSRLQECLIGFPNYPW